ncbi:MAG: DUF5689 domain-containing protein [Ferruginibacter sp.]
MNKIVKLFSGIILLASIGTMSACKKSYDQPPGPTDFVGVVANTNIATLKAIHANAGDMDIITDDIIISGIVTANDKSGNLYKQIFIQDTTGAMQILLEASSVYSSFPVGRRIWVRCKGLCLTDYHQTMELGVLTHDQYGVASVQGILPADISNHIVVGSINNEVVPIPVTVADLGTGLQDRYINALIKLEDFQFSTANADATYADTSAYKNTINDTIQNCPNLGTTLLVRTSAYANFAAVKMPRGVGSITCIYTVYKSSPTFGTPVKQLYIRDTSDVQFNSPRCGSAPTNAIFFENFEAYPASTVTPYSEINIPGWTNLFEVGTYKYTNRTFSSNKYAYSSPFGVTTAKVWLVTKGINLDATTGEELTFDTKQDYYLSSYPSGTPVPSDLKIKLSTNYVPGSVNPWDPSVIWTDVTSSATLSPGTQSGTSAFPSSYTTTTPIDLSSYSGTIYVAFVNEGGTSLTPAKTSSWEIDNIQITGN